MLPTDKEARLRCFRNALRNWRFRGYVNFRPVAEDWLMKAVREVHPNLTLRDIAGELHRYVEAGGEIDEQAEHRPEYVSYEYHYDLRVQIAGQLIYFESVLLCDDYDDPDDPVIDIVSAHDA